MKRSPQSLFRSTLETLSAAPFFFLSLQILDGISSVFAKVLEDSFEANPIAAVLLFFPVFCIASTITGALTFLAVRKRQTTGQTSLQDTYYSLLPFFKRLVGASLAIGLVFVLGFAALIFPAFYFMAIYLFVPQQIVSDKNASLSLALFRSTKAAKKSLGLCIITVIGGLSLGILAFALSESLGKWAGGFSEIPAMQQVTATLLDAFLSMSTGAMIDVWIAHLYLRLTTDELTS